MSGKPIDLPFNPESMTVSDCKAAASTLRDILRDFDNFHDLPEEFTLRVAQIRKAYTVEH